jgi:Ran GTPase-activating protein (RanGAP) involved in mRNA processing and transport
LEKKCLEGTKGLKNYSQEQRFSPLACTPLRKFLATPLVVDQIKETQPSLSVMKISKTSSTNSYQNKRLQQLIEQCKSRSAVNLERQNLTDEDMKIVVQAAIINKQCKVLELSNNKITSVGASIIAGALSNNTTLEELYLMGNRLYDKGVQALTKTLSLNNSIVDYLDVQSTGITDEGAGYIAEMLKINTTLGYLLLSNNEISDRGFQHLANVITHHNTTLRSLFVGRNKLLSDSSVDALVDMLKENPTLNSLHIEKCKLSEKEKERLRQVVRSKKDFNLQV